MLSFFEVAESAPIKRVSDPRTSHVAYCATGIIHPPAVEATHGFGVIPGYMFGGRVCV